MSCASRDATRAKFSGAPRISARPLYTNFEIRDDHKTLPPGLHRLDAEDGLYALDQVAAGGI
jgi:hypothetical protein